MNNHTHTNALHEFGFADKQSERNARLALRTMRGRINAPVGFIISGAPWTGKTLLARYLLGQRFTGVQPSAGATVWRNVTRLLPMAVKAGYLWIDNVDAFKLTAGNVVGATLSRFVTSATWTWRRRRTQECDRDANHTAVFITAYAPDLPPDIAARFHVIQLADF